MFSSVHPLICAATFIPLRPSWHTACRVTTTLLEVPVVMVLKHLQVSGTEMNLPTVALVSTRPLRHAEEPGKLRGWGRSSSLLSLCDSAGGVPPLYTPQLCF